MFEELRKDNLLKRLPDVKVGLRDCFAIQVIPKNAATSDIRHTMIYFAKDIGLDVRTIVYDKKNNPIFTSMTSDIHINPEIPRDRFVLVLPDDVKLQDKVDRR
jgi:outer membrane lipoprotein-sorting protein